MPRPKAVELLARYHQRYHARTFRWFADTLPSGGPDTCTCDIFRFMGGWTTQPPATGDGRQSLGFYAVEDIARGTAFAAKSVMKSTLACGGATVREFGNPSSLRGWKKSWGGRRGSRKPAAPDRRHHGDLRKSPRWVGCTRMAAGHHAGRRAWPCDLGMVSSSTRLAATGKNLTPAFP